MQQAEPHQTCVFEALVLYYTQTSFIFNQVLQIL